MKKIVIVGGGAGGLELATKLGKKLGKKGLAEVLLIDQNSHHLWKPLLHEIATGVLNDSLDNVSYLAQAQHNYFNFQQGRLLNVDRENKTIELAPLANDKGETLFPQTQINYDILVMALGSVSNDFNTPGVKEYCTFLDDQESAKRFRKSILTTFFRFSSKLEQKEKINIAIVGGGATGVELAAELFSMVKTLGSYGFKNLDSSYLNITLIEAANHILSTLPEQVSINIQEKLEQMGVNVLTGVKIVKTDESGFYPENGEPLLADMMIWTAGIKASALLKNISGLETNRINQLVVKNTLQTTNDDAIFALGDCCSCERPEGGFVPATAQAAHQMASLCFSNIVALLKGKSLRSFKYNDKGTIISLAHSAQGVIKATHSSQILIKNRFAYWIYRMLYYMHQVTLFGFFKTIRLIRANKVYRSIRTSINID